MKQFLFSFSIISLLCGFLFTSIANGEEKDTQYYSDTSSDWRVFYKVEDKMDKSDSKYFSQHFLTIENEKRDIKNILKVELYVDSHLILEGKPIVTTSSTDPVQSILEAETFSSNKNEAQKYKEVKLIMYFKDKEETLLLK